MSEYGPTYRYTRLDDNHSGPTNSRAFDVLRKARVVHKIVSCDPSGLPLGARANERRFKAAMLDIGLLQCLCQIPVDLEMRQDDLLAIYRGKLAEQFVAQELIACHSSDLFYWAREARGSNAEVDYLVVRNGQIVPVEVKSGAGGSLRSLHLMLETYPNCPEGMVLYSGPYAARPEKRLTFLPLYYAAFAGDPSPGRGLTVASERRTLQWSTSVGTLQDVLPGRPLEGCSNPGHPQDLGMPPTRTEIAGPMQRTNTRALRLDNAPPDRYIEYQIFKCTFGG
jgi:hypothetical protein